MAVHEILNSILQPTVKNLGKICPISQIILLLHVCREEAQWWVGEGWLAVTKDEEV